MAYAGSYLLAATTNGTPFQQITVPGTSGSSTPPTCGNTPPTVSLDGSKLSISGQFVCNDPTLFVFTLTNAVTNEDGIVGKATFAYGNGCTDTGRFAAGRVPQ